MLQVAYADTQVAVEFVLDVCVTAPAWTVMATQASREHVREPAFICHGLVVAALAKERRASTGVLLDVNYSLLPHEPPAEAQSLRLTSMGLVRLENLSCMLNIKELRVAHNGLTTISGLNELLQLRTLDLSYNSIRCISGLATQTLLTNLYLTHNELSTIEGRCMQGAGAHRSGFKSTVTCD